MSSTTIPTITFEATSFTAGVPEMGETPIPGVDCIVPGGTCEITSKLSGTFTAPEGYTVPDSLEPKPNSLVWVNAFLVASNPDLEYNNIFAEFSTRTYIDKNGVAHLQREVPFVSIEGETIKPDDWAALKGTGDNWPLSIVFVARNADFYIADSLDGLVYIQIPILC